MISSVNFKNRLALTVLFLYPLLLAGQDISKFNLKQPVKVNGGLTATNTFYSSQGMAARRDPYYWMLSGNINFNLFGVLSVPISVQVSQQNRSYTQPFNQFGMSPRYKAWTAHAGYRSVQYSTYSVGGSQWLGGGLEYSPEKHPVYASVLYGRFQKGVNEQVTDGLVSGTPAYERQRMIAGTLEVVKPALLKLAEDFDTEEIVISTFAERHEDRMRSYELLAEAFDLDKVEF
jgi:hypothetical protein